MALFCERDKASDKRLMIANFAIFPTLAAKFLPLKMLTVLSFSFSRIFITLCRCPGKKPVRVDALCVLAVYRMSLGCRLGYI